MPDKENRNSFFMTFPLNLSSAKVALNYESNGGFIDLSAVENIIGASETDVPTRSVPTGPDSGSREQGRACEP